MPVPVLATKLYIALPRPNAVLRPRLIERLNEGLPHNQSSGRRLTLISAPAGFGKTALVSEWVSERMKAEGGRLMEDGDLHPSMPAGASSFILPRPQALHPLRVAWLSLDAGDSDPARFLTYLIAALQTVEPSVGKELLDLLQSPQPPPTEAILTALLNQIATVPDNVVLVLDDYHAIDAAIDARPGHASTSVGDAVTFLLEHLPPQLHLVIATREDPHLPLARLRARGQLTELRAADLRFTPEEAAGFLNDMMGLHLSTEDIAALATRTEGWIAGLQLAALSLQGNRDVSGFIRQFAGDHRYIVDYLVEEVLQSQPEPIRRFLLQTAILDQLNGSLCDALTGNEDGSARLAALQRGNFFVTPLDDTRHWYRYHHLFADVLRMHLLAEQPDQVPALHRRASQWYEHNGSPADAIRHALAAKDVERAAALIELAIPEMRRNRQGAAVPELGWLKALPDELVHCRPVLCVDYAYALFGGGEPAGVETRLRDAERWLAIADPIHPADPMDQSRPVDPPADLAARSGSQPPGMVVVDEAEFRRLPGRIALLRAARTLARGDMPATVKYARRALDFTPQDDRLTLGGAASVLGLAAWAGGDLDAACRMTADAMADLQLAGYSFSVIGCAITLADIYIAQGRLHEAMSTCERALQWAEAPGAPILRGAADMHVGISVLHREHNDLEAATQHLLTSQALGALAELPQNPYRWRAAMARLLEAQGDLDGALDLLDQAERLYDGNFSPNVRPIATRKTRVWLAQGRLADALDWAREQGLSVDDELSYLREFDHITLARLLLARHKSDRTGRAILEALGLLQRLLEAAQAGGRQGSVIEILVLLALAHHAQGDLPAALVTLRHALALAEPEGYVRMFVDEGPDMLQLLREAAARAILPDYANTLLAAFAGEQQQNADTRGPAPTKLLVELLSQRELAILRLIAQGLSNREIGERLFLALDTVKGHNRRIFGKLEVQSRTEAIARASELGLL